MDKIYLRRFTLTTDNKKEVLSFNMRLTKNERTVLRMLIENARVSDSTIALKLNISSQAVGKIRRKLESSFIDSYSLNLNYEKLGLTTFALALVNFRTKNHKKISPEYEEEFLQNPNIIQAMRLPNCGAEFVIMYGFRDLRELDSFFHNQNKKTDSQTLIENKELFTFSNNSIMKNSSAQLFKKLIEEMHERNNLIL